MNETIVILMIEGGLKLEVQSLWIANMYAIRRKYKAPFSRKYQLL